MAETTPDMDAANTQMQRTCSPHSAPRATKVIVPCTFSAAATLKGDTYSLVRVRKYAVTEMMYAPVPLFSVGFGPCWACQPPSRRSPAGQALTISNTGHSTNDR